ncbi:MAG: hypothetical protein R3D55_09090 [Chloroflexota bacterium]
MLDLTHEPDLGYIFYPSEFSHYPGHPRLDVILTTEPTERHFDPSKVQFQVISAQNHLEHLTIHHPWTGGARFRVCAGRIFITDRINKKVEAFTFGGNLQILAESDHTVCALTSPAPIFDLTVTHNLPMWLTAEVEILLAQQKAHWQPHHHDLFDAHLAQIEPFVLYTSCLQALYDKKFPAGEEAYGEGTHFIQAEIKRLKNAGTWPLQLPSLTQLFSD